jgi:hypothetical protein
MSRGESETKQLEARLHAQERFVALEENAKNCRVQFLTHKQNVVTHKLPIFCMSIKKRFKNQQKRH